MTGFCDSTQPAYVIMGVSGSGKSSVGAAVAKRLGLEFIDGDDLHPEDNIARMQRGEALEDKHRFPWLKEVARRLLPGTIIACSALKQSYRDILLAEAPAPVAFLYLRGQTDTLAARVNTRQGHFMPPTLLYSQLFALEEPAPPERVLIADIEAPENDVVRVLIRQIKAEKTMSAR